MSGFAQVPNDVLDDRTIRPSGIVLLAHLDRLARSRGEVRIGTSQLATFLKKSPSTVRDLAAALKRAGWIEIVPQYDENGNQTINLYRLPHRLGGARKPAGVTPDSRRGRAPENPRKCNEKLAAYTEGPKGPSEAAPPAAPAKVGAPSARTVLEPEPEPLAPRSEQDSLRADLYHWRMRYPKRAAELRELMADEWIPDHSDHWTRAHINTIRDFTENDT